MKRASLIRAFGIVLTVFLAASSALAGDAVVEEIIARVNNQIITKSELLRNRDLILNEAKERGITANDPMVEQKMKDQLRDIIDTHLLVQKGKDMGISGDAELVKDLDEMRKQYKLDSIEALEKEAQAQGISFEDFKANRKNEIIRSMVISHEVSGKVGQKISTEEIKQYYEEHKAEMAQPESVRLSEILIAPAGKENEQPTPEAVAEAEQKAKKALAEIKGGKKFEDVAKVYSNGPSAANGGDLGMFKRGTLSKELEDKTFAMKKDEVTDVIRTKQGFVILKVLHHQEEGIPALKDVQDWIADQIFQTRIQPALREYLTKLRDEAYIEVKPGYVDTGTSQNQTTLAATTTPTGAAQAEEKKKKKKFGIF